MKKILTLGLAALFACGTAFAADTKAPDAKANSQQTKMAMCNEKTKGMSKPDADKARSECLKG